MSESERWVLLFLGVSAIVLCYLFLSPPLPLSCTCHCPASPCSPPELAHPGQDLAPPPPEQEPSHPLPLPPSPSERGKVPTRGAVLTFYNIADDRWRNSSAVKFLMPHTVNQCYCLRHDVACHTELGPIQRSPPFNPYGQYFFNKVLVMQKYLPYYRWIMHVDADVLLNTSYSVDAMLDAHPERDVFVSWCTHPHALIDAGGAVIVRNTPFGADFLARWLAYHDKGPRNADNGALILQTIRNNPAYDGSCDTYFYGPGEYRENRPCTERFAGDTGRVMIANLTVHPNEFFRTPHMYENFVAMHGKTIADAVYSDNSPCPVTKFV